MGVFDVNRFTSIIVLLLVLAFLSSPLFVSIAYAADDSWAKLEPLPTIRRDLGVAAVNEKIYVIGGRNDDGYLSTNEEYDPATNTWTTKTPMPTPRSDFGIAVVNDKIYCIGGIIDFDWSGYGKGILCAVNEVYDPLTDTWENKTSMPTQRQRPKANVVNGKIYVMGGFQYRDLPPSQTTVGLDVNEVYDPKTDSWTTKTPIPTISSGPASATIDNKIYVIGGFKSDLNQIYDPESDSWSQGDPIPTAVALAGAGATSGEMAPKRIYVIGGYPSGNDVRLNQVYDPETDTWSSGSQMPTARHSLGVAVVNDILYAIGGGSTNLNVRQYDENEQYIPADYIAKFYSQIFDAGTWEDTQYDVYIVSNSTVSNFSFNSDGARVSFKIEGEPETMGFCNVTIPKNLLYAENTWTVLVDGISVTPTVNEKENYTNLHFTYRHSTKTVEIIGTDAIPEFPSWTPTLLVLVVLAVAVAMYKRKLSRKPN